MAKSVEHNADQYSRRFFALVDTGISGIANKEARYADAQVSALAVGRFMRDAKGEPARRRSNDSGPLRIVTGRLARGTAAKFGRGRGSVEGRTTIEQTTRTTITITKTVSVPYAAVHEYGFQGTVQVPAHQRTSKNGIVFPVRAHSAHRNIPKRAYLQPAADLAMPKIKKHFENSVRQLIDKALEGTDARRLK